MTVKDLLAALQAAYPDYWAWLSSKENALEKVRNLAREAADGGWQEGRFLRQVTALKSYTTFSAGGTEDEPPEEGTPDEELPDIEDSDFPTPEEPGVDQDVRDLLANFLTDNDLPQSLMSFIEGALADKWSYARIVAELRQTPEYRQAYPEMELRRQNGWDAMTEAEIRGYRSEARRLASEYFGSTLTNQDIATMLGVRNKSIREYEQDLQTWRKVEEWGPAVKFVLGGELGYEPDDELVFRFLHGEIRTPELDRAYNRALLRGQPAAIGLGIRPEEEADILTQFGINPEQAFKGYQTVVGEMSRAERLQAIESHIGRNRENFPTGAGLFNDTPFGTLFRAIQLNDADALRELQVAMSREVARFRAGGGLATAGSGAAVGLLTADERRRQ